MNEDTELLRPLDVTDLPPSKVDLRRAVRVGRRRERLRTVALSGTTVVAVLATVAVTYAVAGRGHTAPGTGPAVRRSGSPAPTAPALGTCTFADLALHGVDLTDTNVVTDPSGRFSVVVAADDPAAFVRFAGVVPQRITGAPAGDLAVGAVNRSGDFLGTSGDKVAYVYRHGTFTRVPLPVRATQVVPIGLDDRGDAVVDVFFTDSDGTTRVQAAVWPATEPGGLRVLDTPAGHSSYAVGIAADGTVAGFVSKIVVVPQPSQSPAALADPSAAPDPAEPAVWTAVGARRVLRVLATDPNPIMTAINGDWVLARHTRWNLRTGTVEPVTGIWGERLDKYGRVYGEQPDIAPPHPAVWVDGTVTRLPTDSARPLGMMGAVNDDGTRITSVLQADNPPDPRPVVWTCR